MREGQSDGSKRLPLEMRGPKFKSEEEKKAFIENLAGPATEVERMQEPSETERNNPNRNAKFFSPEAAAEIHRKISEESELAKLRKQI